MAAMLAGCPDDGTTATTLSDESSSSSDGGSVTNSTITATTAMTADTSGGTSADTTDTDVSTTRTTTDTDVSTSTDATAESSSSGGGPVCGDDVADPGEDCDGTDLAGQTCVTQGFGGGTLACADDCTFDTTACTDNCGNGTIDAGEDCDGVDLGGEDCTTQGFDSGTLACGPDCTFNTSNCTMDTCGDGMTNGAEVCDGADLAGQDCVTQGFDGGTLSCAGNCMAFDTSLCTSGDTCCMAQMGITGCGDDTCESTVCAQDGYCCMTEWDGICVGEAYDLCQTVCVPACGDGIASAGVEQCDGGDLDGQDCVSQGFGGGMLACDGMCNFDTSACVDQVCGDDLIEGGETCDGTDVGTTSCIDLGVQPSGTGVSNCCFNHQPATGCDDAACEGTVCAADAFCCDNSWDNICSDEAATLCAADLCPDPTCNGTCDGFTTISCNADLGCVEQDIGSVVGAAVASGTIVGEDEDIAETCGLGGVEHTFVWVAPADANYTFDLAGSDYDTVLQLFSDCAGTSLACNDDALPGNISALSIDLTAGQQVIIAVSGFSNAQGNYVLNISSTAGGPTETLSGCDPAFCTFTVGAGPNGGDLCSCQIPGVNHPVANDYGDATCFGGTPANDMLWALGLAGYTNYTVTTCNFNAGDSALATYDNDPALGGVQAACNDDAAGEPGFCSEITDSGSGVAQGTPTAVPASGLVYVLIDEWNPGNYWNGLTTRQLDFEAIP
jgi:hypothetical protein